MLPPPLLKLNYDYAYSRIIMTRRCKQTAWVCMIFNTHNIHDGILPRLLNYIPWPSSRALEQAVHQQPYTGEHSV